MSGDCHSPLAPREAPRSRFVQIEGPSILTIPEVAARIGRNKDTVRLWCKKIPIWTNCIAYRNGRRPYLSVSRMRAAGLLS